jgi:tRNA/tmRNA/rRNA uracil-C5-methylase (TrmA/RlmC/RlmD family)
MDIKVSNAVEFAVEARRVLNNARETLIKKLAAEAQKTIEEKSKGQLQTTLETNNQGFTISVPLDLRDGGEKARAIERQTQAFKSAYDELSTMSSAVNILKETK